MRAAVHGIWGGLLGGLVFALIMVINGTLTNMGMLTLPLIGELVGAPSAVAGFVVHMFNSALFGVVYALLLARIGKGMLYGMHVGMIYGAAWWFLGPLTLMPKLLGMSVGSQWSFANALSMFPSLIGHLVYGAILGMVVGSLGPGTSLEPESETASDEPGEKKEKESEPAASTLKDEDDGDDDAFDEPPKKRRRQPIFLRRRTRETDGSG